MERPRILVVHFSRTGHTKRLARAIAAAAGADLEEIRDPTDRSGLVGYFRSGAEAFAGLMAPVERPRRDAAEYDLVVVGTPVWSMSLSSPIRTYLWYERPHLRQVGFFATLGGVGDERAFRQMKVAAGHAPVATLAVREKRLEEGVPKDEVARFVEALLSAHRKRPQRRKLRAVG